MRLTAISTAVLAAFASVALSAPAPAPVQTLTDGPDTELTAPQRLATPGQEQAKADLVGYNPDLLTINETTAEVPVWVKTSKDENAAVGGREEQGGQEEDHKQKEARILSKRATYADCLACMATEIVAHFGPLQGYRHAAAATCRDLYGKCTQAAIDGIRNDAGTIARRAGWVWAQGSWIYDSWALATW